MNLSQAILNAVLLRFRPNVVGQRGMKNIVGYIDPLTLGNKPPSRRDRRRMEVEARKRPAPGPKFEKARKHKPHVHPIWDDLGAYTLTGARPGRRKWVAGESAFEARMAKL